VGGLVKNPRLSTRGGRGVQKVLKICPRGIWTAPYMICALRSVSSYLAVVLTCKMRFCQQHFVKEVLNKELKLFQVCAVKRRWHSILFEAKTLVLGK